MAEQFSGSLYIVAAPSGGGKTSLVKKLVSELDDIAMSLSHTTREKRRGEQDGVDYCFIPEQTFQEMIKANEFVEYANVFGHYYGTSLKQIKARLQAGIDVVLDIDWQGARQIRQQFADAVSIFVIPPSLDVLKQRLTTRRRDDEAVIQKRMKSAQDELAHFAEFDYLIVNEDFSKAANQLRSIVVAHRLRMSRQRVSQRQLLSFLLSSK